ncbi:MAG: hypothetical protein Q9198_001269 [Flavoplaca austrocitrina]
MIRDGMPREISRRLRSEVESEKVAIHLSRRRAIWQGLIHVAPIVITLTVLQFSFRTVYWSDLEGSDSNQNAVLNILQFVAKAHEICIAVSLSAVVLHRIQWDLTGKEGVPFGLVAAGYQVSSITYLWSMQFWAGIFEYELLRSYLKRFRLFLLVVAAAIIIILAGPSSAIAVIPRLEWWAFSSTYLDSTKIFIPIPRDKIWPLRLTEAHVDKLHCYSTQTSNYHHCPSAGIPIIRNWNPSVNWDQGPNITVPIPKTATIRSLVGTRADPNVMIGFTVSSTMSHLTTRTISCVWSRVRESLLNSPSELNRPLFEASLASSEALLKPVVGVACLLHSIPSKQRMRFALKGVPVWVPDETWNSSTRVTDPIKLTWTKIPSRSSIGVVVVLTVQDRHNRPVRMVAPCLIDARWIPVSMWLDPSRDNSVYDDQIAIINDPNSPVLRKTQRISIEPGWAKALNVRLQDSNRSSLEQLITTYISRTYWKNLDDDELYTHDSGNSDRIDEQVNIKSNLPTQISGSAHREDWQISSRNLAKPMLLGMGEWKTYQYTGPQYTRAYGPQYQDLISYALSLSIADGLARVQSNVSTYAVRKLSLKQVIEVLCSSRAFFVDDSFIAAAKQTWTEMKFKTSRFGYGWGLRGKPIKFAAAVLLADALICLLHIIYMVWGGWTSSVVATIGELVALVTNSLPSEKLKNTCAGIKKPKTWQKMVAVRETSTCHLELVFEDGSDDEMTGKMPIPGKSDGRLSKSCRREMIVKRRFHRKYTGTGE